jgi:rhodanese-related sulfurtransferase
MQSLTPEQLKERLEQTGSTPILIDVREGWEYEICHIDGSRHLPMSEIVANMDSLDKDAETVVICHHGIRSQQVAQYLHSQGFMNIYNLDGGIEAWAESVDPDMDKY